MGRSYATCGHETTELNPPHNIWLFDGGELSWLVYCETCFNKLTPVYFYSIEEQFMPLLAKENRGSD